MLLKTLPRKIVMMVLWMVYNKEEAASLLSSVFACLNLLHLPKRTCLLENQGIRMKREQKQKSEEEERKKHTMHTQHTTI